jgi:hypothetical protein
MWLEEMAWLCLPSAGGVGIWVIWSIVTLKRDVRALEQRLAQIEAPFDHPCQPGVYGCMTKATRRWDGGAWRVLTVRPVRPG